MDNFIEWFFAMLVRYAIPILMVFLILLTLAVASCATAEPYGRLGLYEQVNHREASGLILKGELGYEWDHASCGWVHISELERGSPFNHKWEVLAFDGFGCSGEIGGK